MTNDEVIKELSILLQLKNIEWHGKEKQAVVYAVETLKRIDAEKIKEILQITLCNGTTDCENYPECPTEDGCQPFDLSKAIVNYLKGE